MKGIIDLIGPRHIMIGVCIKDDSYSVLELIGDYSCELGDILSGELESLGGEDIKNITQNEGMDVFIQDIHCSKKSAWNLISQY